MEPSFPSDDDEEEVEETLLARRFLSWSDFKTFPDTNFRLGFTASRPMAVAASLWDLPDLILLFGGRNDIDS